MGAAFDRLGDRVGRVFSPRDGRFLAATSSSVLQLTGKNHIALVPEFEKRALTAEA